MNDDELRWMAAIQAWFARDRAPLAEAIADEALPLSGEARLFFADLVRNAVQKPKGAPPKYNGWMQRAIAAKAFAEWKRLGDLRSDDAQQEAFELAAKELGLTDGQVRGVVQRLGAHEGMTFDVWLSLGEPRWDLHPT